MWYYAVPGERLRRGKTLAKTLLGEPLLLGRADDGKVFALRNICPHRGIPLSYGRFDGHEIECCYHGWRFAPSGPARRSRRWLRVSASICRPFGAGLSARARKAAMSGSSSARMPASAPPPPALPSGFAARRPESDETVTLPCGIDHAVVGLMDPAHGPFVHRSWWWRSARSIHEKSKAFAASPYGFTMLRHAPSSNSKAYKLLGGAPETEISFSLPGVRIEHIIAGKHEVVQSHRGNAARRTGDADQSRDLLDDAVSCSLLKPLLRPYVRAFLNQDRAVMVRQREGLKFDPPLALIDDADTQARWYYRLKTEYARAKQRRPRLRQSRDGPRLALAQLSAQIPRILSDRSSR